mgnify:CR=1 FL=1
MLNDGEKGVIIQRDKQTYAVAPHIPCGVVSGDTLRKLADVSEKYQAKALKITSASRIAIVGINEKDVDAVWSELGICLLYTSPSPRDLSTSRMPSSA